MPDRVLNKPATIIADLPSLTDEALTITVTDSIGTTVVPADPATPLGDGRYAYTVDAGAVTRAGIWNARFTQTDVETGAATVIASIDFSVGRQVAVPTTKYQLRYLVARRVAEAVNGSIDTADEESIADPTLVGGAKNFRGWWLMLHPDHPEAGIPRRVTDYNGSALIISPPFSSVPPTRTRYYLSRVSPYELDEAIAVALAEISRTARIETQIAGIPAFDGIFTVPNGIHHITSLWVEDAEVAFAASEMLPNRRVRLGAAYDTTAAVTLVGLRGQTPLNWEDSTLDIEPSVVVAKAVVQLHAGRVAGAGVDVEEHLRRQITAQNEFDALIKRVSGRLVSGSKAVIE